MPAQSNQQRMAACVALAAKKGEKRVSKLKGPAKSMYKSMSKSELEEYCKSDVES